MVGRASTTTGVRSLTTRGSGIYDEGIGFNGISGSTPYQGRITAPGSIFVNDLGDGNVPRSFILMTAR
jgi:hypothetical protein